VPSRSSVLKNSTDYVKESSIWYRCPEYDELKAVGIKYDIWCAGWTLFNFCSLEDGRFILDPVENFNDWKKPDIPRVYSRQIDKLFKK